MSELDIKSKERVPWYRIYVEDSDMIIEVRERSFVTEKQANNLIKDLQKAVEEVRKYKKRHGIK